MDRKKEMFKKTAKNAHLNLQENKDYNFLKRLNFKDTDNDHNPRVRLTRMTCCLLLSSHNHNLLVQVNKVLLTCHVNKVLTWAY